MTLLYAECPECQYDCVIEEPPAGAMVGCPLCFTDCLHVVEMLTRPVRDDDRPEGYDARTEGVIPMVDLSDPGAQAVAVAGKIVDVLEGTDAATAMTALVYASATMIARQPPEKDVLVCNTFGRLLLAGVELYRKRAAAN